VDSPFATLETAPAQIIESRNLQLRFRNLRLFHPFELKD
jgi:hypothetical protein